LSTDSPRSWRLSDIHVRDPFILRDPGKNAYYLYGTTDADPWTGPGRGFDCYRSVDLVTWDGPFPAFRPREGFWGRTGFWAPEVYAIDGLFAMFATFTGGGERGTQLLVAEDPRGPFEPRGDGALTPRGWSCLDGTLFVEGEERWLVYCREWTQIRDGSIIAQQLTQDLSATVGEPVVLFHASAAKWSRPVVYPGEEEATCHITDGPFLTRTTGGELVMLWSSIGDRGYATGIARSDSAGIHGPWRHDAHPLWAEDGGHAMIFSDAAGESWLTLHQPNTTPLERTRLTRVIDTGTTLRLAR